jgi:hypothetical protein
VAVVETNGCREWSGERERTVRVGTFTSCVGAVRRLAVFHRVRFRGEARDAKNARARAATRYCYGETRPGVESGSKLPHSRVTWRCIGRGANDIGRAEQKKSRRQWEPPGFEVSTPAPRTKAWAGMGVILRGCSSDPDGTERARWTCSRSHC